MTYIKNQILQIYSLLPFWGRFERWEYTKLQFDRKTLSDFTYKNAVRNTKFVRNLKEQLKSEIFPYWNFREYLGRCC